MDIIDIILGSAFTPQGEVETYASLAQKAVLDAAAAVNDIQSITQQTNANNTAAQEALSTVNSALAALDVSTTSAVDAEMKKFAIILTTVNNQDSSTSQRITIHYPDNTQEIVNNVVKYYTTIGNNTDGTMTQRAISNAITNAVNAIDIPVTNLGAANANKIVIVGPTGNLIPSANITEEQLINGGGNSGGGNEGEGDTPTPTPTPATGIVGLKINYATAIMTPTDDAVNATLSDFNNFSMYGGRKRCLVDNTGVIEAFYGDNNYTDTPSNGYQVMVYQPKFYYRRTPTQVEVTNYGTVIREEIIQLSPTEQTDFTLHPLFRDESGNTLEYVLLSAYEGSLEVEEGTSYQDITYNDYINGKLSSVSGAKPFSGTNNFLNVTTAEKLASNRGVGWHISTSKSLSAQQMLAIVELGSLNVQTVFNEGISDLDAGGVNETRAATTGATKALGNQTGQASSTVFNYGGSDHVETAAGKVAISYRGYENPWGNMWDYVGDIMLEMRSSSNHIVNICNNYNYADTLTGDYTALNIKTPPTVGWISGFAYDVMNDWIFIPIELGANANSLVPVGDYFFGSRSSSGVHSCINGGPWFGEANNGLFYYTFDRNTTESGGKNIGARLLHVPTVGSSVYINNVIKWNTKMGG